WSNGNPFRYLNWDSGRFTLCFMSDTIFFCVDMGFCSAPWIPYNGHCFHLYRTDKTWADARSACRKEGGDLASIRNLEDQSFVIAQLGYDEVWIGLNDKKTEGLFDWTDHSTVSFTSWEFGKPTVTSGQEDCVLISGESFKIKKYSHVKCK
uniref:C-type lectin domain-containing protein n=1 Tax=Kryptolebias marmoratus TaxID=37003 RepID=A0A3Q2ZE58_KRYMA